MNNKALQVIFLFFTAFSLLVSGCKKEADLGEPGIMWVGNSPGSETSKSPYNVLLENKIQNKNGTFTWIWSVSNSNPGSGAPGSGTAQDLLSWGITLGSCADLGQVISGSTSPDGVTWNNFNPEVKSNPEVTSTSKPVLMFEQGTYKSQKSYYKLIVSRNFSVNNSISAIYKTGAGSGNLTISGFGCPIQ